MTVLPILTIFLLLYTGCLCHPLGVSQTLLTGFARNGNEKKGTIRISGPWHSDSALDRNIDPGEDSYVKKVISSNEGINFNKDMAEAGEMFDVNGIEDFYDKNAMVTYELNGHEIPVHLKQKYTPQTKSLFPEYNRDSTATAGAMIKSTADCSIQMSCSTTTTASSDQADSKQTVAQQMKGAKNLFALRHLLQLHSNQYGENHGQATLPQKGSDLSQENANKELLMLPWKFSTGTAQLGSNDNSDTKSTKSDESANEDYNKLSNTNLIDQSHRVSEDTSNSDHGTSTDTTANDNRPMSDDNTGPQLPSDQGKIASFVKMHSASISNMPSMDELHAMEDSQNDVMKQFDHGNNLLPSKDAEAAGLINKLPNQLLNTPGRDNDLESSKTLGSPTDSSDMSKASNPLPNAFQQANDLGPASDMTKLLSMRINDFMKPLQQRNDMLPPRDSPGPPSNSASSDVTNNAPSDIDDGDKGKAKGRILSLLGELTDKLKGVEAVVAAQHKVAQAEHGEENSDISKPRPPEQSEGSLSSETPAEQLQHSFADAEGISYKPLPTTSKFEQKLSPKAAELPHNALESDNGKQMMKGQDLKEYRLLHNSSPGDFPYVDGHPHQPFFTAHNQYNTVHEAPYPSHDFPHSDLHEDALHNQNGPHYNDLDMNSPHVVSGTTPLHELTQDARLGKTSPEASNTNEVQPEVRHTSDDYDTQRVYHGNIHEVDLKEAHSDIYPPKTETDDHPEAKAERNGVHHEEYNRFSDEGPPAPGKAANAHTQADLDAEREKEKLIPEQIQKLKDQGKPFIMNTESIDYQPKDHKEEPAEQEHGLSSITPEFKQYDDNNMDNDRGKISKYGHSPEHTPNDDMKSRAYNNDDSHGKSEVHKSSQESKTPEKDIRKTDTKSEDYNHDDGNRYHHHHEEDREYRQPEKVAHDKEYDQSGSRKGSHDMEYIKSDKTKESGEKEFAESHEREYKTSQSNKDSNDREKEESHDAEARSPTGKQEVQEKESSHSENRKQSFDTRYKDPESSKESHDMEHVQPDKPKESGGKEFVESHEREHKTSQSNKDSNDREKEESHEREASQSAAKQEVKGKEPSLSDNRKDSFDTRYKDPDSSKGSRDMEHVQSDKTKESVDKEFGEPHEREYKTSQSNKDSNDREKEGSHEGEANKPAAKQEVQEKEPNHSDNSKESFDTRYKKAESSKRSHEMEYARSDKNKEPGDKEFGEPHEREYKTSQSNKDSNDKENEGSHDRETNKPTAKQEAQEKETNHSDNKREQLDTGYKSDNSKGLDKNKELDKDKESPDTWTKKNDREKEVKGQHKESKYDKGDDDNYITSTLKEHIIPEHTSYFTHENHGDGARDESKAKRLLESVSKDEGEHKGRNIVKQQDVGNIDHHLDTSDAASHQSVPTSDDHLRSEGAKEHDQNWNNKDKGKPQNNEYSNKTKQPNGKSLGAVNLPQPAVYGGHGSETASVHQLGTDRERTFTPKAKYTDETEYPDYNEVKDAALFETNYIRKQFHAKKMSWSDRLSDKAQQLAEKVAKSVNIDANNNKVDQYKHPGETIAVVKLDAINVGKDAIDIWAKESKQFDFKSPSVTKRNSDFVQLVWKANNEFGMGVSKSKAGSGWIVTAFYDTPYIDKFLDLRSNLQPDSPVEDPYGDIAG